MPKDAYELFFEEVDKILEKVRETQKENILEAAKIVSECIKNDGLVYAFGTGHSHMLSEELCFRASTLAPIYAVLEPSLTGHQNVVKTTYAERLEGFGKIILDHLKPTPKDAFIVISNSGRNASPIEVAMEAKRRGNKVIGVTSKTYSKNVSSRHSSGKKLMDIADVTLDNCGKLGDYSVNLEGLEQGVGPTSMITEAYLLHAVMVQATSNLLEVMEEPPVFWSGNLPEGMEKNQKILDKYWKRMRNW